MSLILPWDFRAGNKENERNRSGFILVVEEFEIYEKMQESNSSPRFTSCLYLPHVLIFVCIFAYVYFEVI